MKRRTQTNRWVMEEHFLFDGLCSFFFIDKYESVHNYTSGYPRTVNTQHRQVPTHTYSLVMQDQEALCSFSDSYNSFDAHALFSYRDHLNLASCSLGERDVRFCGLRCGNTNCLLLLQTRHKTERDLGFWFDRTGDLPLEAVRD